MTVAIVFRCKECKEITIQDQDDKFRVPHTCLFCKVSHSFEIVEVRG